MEFASRAERAGLGSSCFTPRGARVFKLRDRPPERIDDDFAERLRSAYDAFPGVGVR